MGWWALGGSQSHCTETKREDVKRFILNRNAGGIEKAAFTVRECVAKRPSRAQGNGLYDQTLQTICIMQHIFIATSNAFEFSKGQSLWL